MASVRIPRRDEQTSYHVVDRDGNVVGHGATKSAASRDRNRLAREGHDVTGWTLRPIIVTPKPSTTEG